MTPFPGADLLMNVAFGLAVVATGVGALIAVLSRRLIRSVCGLALACFGLAGLFYFLHSPFLALMEILIYVGAVCVTIVFAVMLAEPDEPSETGPDRPPGGGWWTAAALVMGLAVFWGVARLGNVHPWTRVDEPIREGTLSEIGIALLTTYSMAFETISLVLVIAIIGALVIARHGRTQP